MIAEAIDIVDTTYRLKNSKVNGEGYDWGKFSALQRDLISWIDGDRKTGDE